MEEKLLIYYMWYPSKESPQTHHENGRYLLKQALKNEYDIEFTEEMLEHKEYGKPVLKHGPVQFSISHCKGMAVCVLSPFALGADTEGPRRVTEALIDRVCCEKESRYVKEYGCRYKAQRFLRLWTLKESYLKMTGEGLRLPLDQVQFEITRELEPGKWVFPKEIGSSRQGNFWQIELKKDYILSICMEKTEESSSMLKKEPTLKEILHW
ncbi:MAG: 4'-phosphopantetheinyl transferase superfamily protein [Lachnospiraceae bacterium]|jgi:4'-phosphopantetheinyl transferase|nr:4'-phosphopantetheinyl transferase superfamily protein [Lachnospiraceae bacterium]